MRFRRLPPSLETWQRTLVIMFLAQLSAAIGFSNIFPFLPLYVEELGTNTSFSVEFLSGMVFSSQAVTMMIASPLWGLVADRYGRKLMVERATFGGSVILLAMGFVPNAEMLILLRAIQGLVTGTVAAANALVAAEAPRERTGFAMGVVQVGLWGGVSLGPLIGGALADAVGYRWTFVLTAVLLLVSGVLVHFGVRETAGHQGDDGDALSLLDGWRHIFQAEGVTTAYALRFLSGLGNVLIVPIAPLFLKTLMEDTTRLNTVTGLMIGLASAATTATAVYLGRLGDKIGHRKVLWGSALLAGLFYLPQSLVTESWQLIALRVLTGAAAGGVVPTVSALLTGYTEQGEEGTVFGLDNSVLAGSRAVAPMLGAWIAAAFNYRAVFVGTAVLYLIVAVVAATFLPKLPPGAARTTDGGPPTAAADRERVSVRESG